MAVKDDATRATTRHTTLPSNHPVGQTIQVCIVRYRPPHTWTDKFRANRKGGFSLAGKLIRVRRTRLQCMLFVLQESAMLAEVTQEIIDLVKTEATEVDLTADSDLQDVGLDSLKFMSVVFKVEARYDIELQEGC
jgi:acyl carrier protein